MKVFQKPTYNEGDHISSAPAAGGTPVWKMTRTKTPVSITHIPCGYWTRNYNPDDALSVFTVESISGGFNFSFNRSILSAEITPSPGLGTLTKINDTMYQYLWAVGDCMFDTETIEFEVDDGGVVVTYQHPYEYTGGTGCCGESIGYTTQSMSPLEDQELTVVDGWAERDYVWAIASGGGSLSSESGMSVTYTAPSSNSNCTDNPTITLSIDRETCDTLQIAVNQYTGTEDDNSYLTWTRGNCSAQGLGYVCGGWVKAYDCTGTLTWTGDYNGYSGHGGDCDDCWTALEAIRIAFAAEEPCYSTPRSAGICDNRTAALLLAGCCPEELI